MHIVKHNKTTYDGEGMAWKAAEYFQAMFVPHGHGKWVFPGNVVLEGECVAWKGEPRWFIQPPSSHIIERRERSEIEEDYRTLKRIKC